MPVLRIWFFIKGLKKVLSHCHRQVDSPSEQVTFHSWWARDQESHLPTKSLKEQNKTCPGQAKLRTTWPTGKLEYNLFSSLDIRIASLFVT